MSASLINIAGKEWVVELLWRTETGRKAKKNATEIAKKFNDDLMCTRTLPAANYGASAIQVGLTSSRDLGKKAKSIPSLAAALASLKDGSWLGAFALESGHFFALVIKDGAILSSGGDRLFSTEEELLQYINGQRKIADWDFIVSADVSVDGAETVDLSAILSASRASAPTLNFVGSYFRLSGDFPIVRVIQIVVISGLAAIYFWPENKPQPLMVTQPKAPPPQPWPIMPSPSAWIEACVNKIETSQSAIGGWELVSISCDGTTASIKMKRTKLGAYGDMLNAGATLGQDNTTATLSRTMKKEALQGSEPQRDMSIKYRLSDAVERQGDSIEIRSVPPPLPGSEVNQAPPTWLEMLFQIRTDNDIHTFGWFDSMPGLRVTKISYTPAETPIYKIEGVIYVNK